MKLGVPFYKQANETDCGPTALEMVLGYFGENHSREKLAELVEVDKSGVTWTIGIAKASAELKFKTEFYTARLGLDPSHYDLKFYQNEADTIDDSSKKVERLKKSAHVFGAVVAEKKLTLEEILSKISENCVPIVLLDWSKITPSERYQGHIVPIVGYDEQNVYVHNQGLKGTKDYFEIDRTIFEEARTSKGTDEDIVFIYRKH